jgi:hypothetical protein
MKKITFIFMFCYIVFFLGVKQSNLIAQTQLKVFLMAGQSNMVGYGGTSFLPTLLKKPQKNIQIYVFGTANFNWGPLRPGLGTSINSFGSEITFGQNIAKKLSASKIAIIKGAWSGMNLDQEWRPPSSGGTTGQLYVEFVKNVKAAINSLGSDYKVDIAGMCWMQGESDATDTTMAVNYKVNLSNFISDLRKEFNVPDMPFIIGMIDTSKIWKYSYTVRKAETDLAKTGHNIGIFDTHGYISDGVHYYTKSVLRLGSDFATSMLKYFK